MFTDMVGYTALGQRNESLSLALVDEQRKLIRPILARHNGREIKTIGDAFLVEFPSALDAVRCAYDIQRATREFNISLPTEKRIHLRVGLHLGDVVESGGDISGDAVNVASRIEPLAEDGGVCLTRQVYESTHNKFDAPFVSIGLKSLKNVNEPMEVYRMELPWEHTTVAEAVPYPTNRIAVLPFVSMSPDPSDEYFADGLTEELIDRLCQISGLEVIARTSAMSYKKKEKNAAQIGKELRAGALVEGSVRKEGNKVRVTAQLINANTEGHLWSSRYDRDLQSIFAVQSDIAERVADALEVQLLPHERKAIEKQPTTSREAHILYLKGIHHWNERSAKSVKAAIECFEKAIVEDPSFALAYNGLADCYAVLVNQGFLQPLEIAPRIRNWVEKALQLDPSLAEAHTTLGWELMTRSYDWKGAELEFKRSIELNQSYATARQWYGLYLFFNRRTDEALRESEKALELDPFSIVINFDHAWQLAVAGSYQQAIEQAMKAVSLDPLSAIAHFALAQVYMSGSQYESAVAELKKSLELDPGFRLALSWLGRAYALLGRGDSAEKTLSDLNKASLETYVSPSNLAIVEFALGRKEEAFKHFDEALEQRSELLLYLVVLPGFEDMRTDVRFVRIVERLGLRSGLEPRPPGERPV